MYLSLEHVTSWICFKWQSFLSVSANWHENGVQYDDCSYSFRSWKLEVASIRVKILHCLILGVYHYSGLPLWTGYVNASFNLAESKHKLTFPFGFGTNTKQWQHSVVSSNPWYVIISCSCSHSNSLNGLLRHRIHILVALDMNCC